MNISLEDISLLHFIYRHGSITEAAKRIGLSQSSASKKLQSIEESCGVKLFDRTTRTISITSTGLEFLNNTASIPKTLQKAIECLSEHKKGAPKALNIDLSRSLSNSHVPGFIPRHKNPTSLALRVSQYSQKDIIKRLTTFITDIAVVPHSHELDRVCNIHRQIDDDFCIVMNQNNPPPSMKHLSKWGNRQKWILPAQDDITYFQVKSWLAQININTATFMEIPQFDLINHLVALDHGVALVPKRSTRLFYNKKLLKIITAPIPMTRKISIVSPLNTPNSELIRAYLDTVLFS